MLNWNRPSSFAPFACGLPEDCCPPADDDDAVGCGGPGRVLLFGRHPVAKNARQRLLRYCSRTSKCHSQPGSFCLLSPRPRGQRLSVATSDGRPSRYKWKQAVQCRFERWLGKCDGCSRCCGCTEYCVHRNDAGTYQPSQPRPVEFWTPSGSAIGCLLINATKCSTVNAGPGLVRWGTLCVGRWRTELLLPLFFCRFRAKPDGGLYRFCTPCCGMVGCRLQV